MKKTRSSNICTNFYKKKASYENQKDKVSVTEEALCCSITEQLATMLRNPTNLRMLQGSVSGQKTRTMTQDAITRAKAITQPRYASQKDIEAMASDLQTLTNITDSYEKKKKQLEQEQLKQKIIQEYEASKPTNNNTNVTQ